MKLTLLFYFLNIAQIFRRSLEHLIMAGSDEEIMQGGKKKTHNDTHGIYQRVTGISFIELLIANLE